MCPKNCCGIRQAWVGCIQSAGYVSCFCPSPIAQKGPSLPDVWAPFRAKVTAPDDPPLTYCHRWLLCEACRVQLAVHGVLNAADARVMAASPLRSRWECSAISLSKSSTCCVDRRPQRCPQKLVQTAGQACGMSARGAQLYPAE